MSGDRPPTSRRHGFFESWLPQAYRRRRGPGAARRLDHRGDPVGRGRRPVGARAWRGPAHRPARRQPERPARRPARRRPGPTCGCGSRRRLPGRPGRRPRPARAAARQHEPARAAVPRPARPGPAPPDRRPAAGRGAGPAAPPLGPRSGGRQGGPVRRGGPGPRCGSRPPPTTACATASCRRCRRLLERKLAVEGDRALAMQAMVLLAARLTRG